MFEKRKIRRKGDLVIMEITTADGQKQTFVMSPEQARAMDRSYHNLPAGIRSAERGR
jgi:hypothetical protein